MIRPASTPARLFLLRACVAVALLLGLAGTASADGRPGDFDFYVLALSWAPTHCALDADRGPCREEGRAFVVHGLWPQYEHGYPGACRSDEPRTVPRSLAATIADLIPDPGLVQHEWEQHGTCTGLKQPEFLAKIRRAAERVTIPAAFRTAGTPRTIPARDMEDSFVLANPGLSPYGIALACENGAVEEVRICMTRELDFRRCQEVDRRGCKGGRLLLPAAGQQSLR